MMLHPYHSNNQNRYLTKNVTATSVVVAVVCLLLILSLASTTTTTIKIPILTPTMAYRLTVPVVPWKSSSSSSSLLVLSSTKTSSAVDSSGNSHWFASLSVTGTAATASSSPKSLEQHKAILLHLGAVLDRGQAYNPTSGEYYRDRMDIAIQSIQDMIEQYPHQAPNTLQQISGEWELILSTVPHGIFRSSPFFLAIQEAYCTYADEKEALGINKAELFFRLHELQTCSWGISKVGRVAQHIVVDEDSDSNRNINNTNEPQPLVSSSPNTGYLYSEFDTSIFSLTVIPLLGWFKLLPTFGGCVVTAAKCTLLPNHNNNNNNNNNINSTATTLQMTVDYTTARPIPGLSGLGGWIWNIQVPVQTIWKLLPWNQNRPPTCQVYIPYVDDDFRIVQDISGDYFVYTRPVIPRPLDLVTTRQ